MDRDLTEGPLLAGFCPAAWDASGPKKDVRICRLLTLSRSLLGSHVNLPTTSGGNPA